MYLDYIMARDPDYYRSLPFRDQVEIALMTSFKRLTKGLASRVAPEQPIQFSNYYTYDPALVDSHGDMTGHLAERRPANCPVRDAGVCQELRFGLPAAAPGFPMLAAFCKWAAENHIRVLATFPNMAHQPAYDLPTALAVETQLREFFAAQGVPIVGSLHDALMPPSDFFDTNYHPTEEASKHRTVRLAAELKPWFTHPAPPTPSNP